MGEGFIAQILLPALLGILMIGVGTSLSKSDFRSALTDPKPIILGLLGQIILLPMIGIGFCYIFKLPPEFAVGLILIACTPGGIGSNILTYLAKADSSLSVSLTSISNILAILTMPIVFNISSTLLPQAQGASEAYQVSLPFIGTFIRLLLVILVPIFVGIKIKEFKPELCDRIQSHLRVASGLFLTVICLGFIVKERERLGDAILAVGLPVYLLNAFSTLTGYLLGKAGKLPNKQVKTLGIEVGFQNGALAMTMAIGILGNPMIAIPAVVYGGIMFINVALFVMLTKRM